MCERLERMTRGLAKRKKEYPWCQAFTDAFVVEQAHRSLTPRPPVSGPLPPLIARLLNYRDRDTALRLAHERGPINYQGSTLSFFLDVTQTVQVARGKYADVKNTLRKQGLKYSMLYRARLRLEVNGRPRIFNSPNEVVRFCKHRQDASKPPRSPTYSRS
ncbi:hypothetical protein NDU88_001612 [Pleurodeles waltl]|uniref:Uncharacterized protein n=1 Tax=Pleurodeles waltl TaxID=8319 RepID=A0AAV7Q7N5_PLEWA|nr:hypothetical protein NDU88_001612 [Pleurodeles waltl]